MDWPLAIARIAAEVEDRVERTRGRIERRIIGPRSVRLMPFRGYGTAARVRVRGRVLFGAQPGPATPEDRWWVNLVNTYRRLESDRVGGARVLVRYRGAEQEVSAGTDGHFAVEIEPRQPPAGDRFWQEARLDMVDPPGDGAVATLSVPDRADFGVISDLDDTVVRTGASSMVRVAREVLFGNAHTRVPFPGVAAFYRALHRPRGPVRNPFFYVSSSPWSLYDVLAEFLRLHHIPAGPMELREWRIGRDDVMPIGHREHKREAIDRILRTYPDLPFILVGDSGQEDPEIYRSVVDDHPGRIRAIYIRSVSEDPHRLDSVAGLAAELRDHPESAPELVLVRDTKEAAEHAAARGWIDSDALAAVDRLRRAESATPADRNR